MMIKALLGFSFLLSLFSCSKGDDFYKFDPGEDKRKTEITFHVVGENNEPIKEAYIVSYRSLPPLHIRTGEGVTNVKGELTVSDETNTTEGYATIVAPGYNAKKISLSLTAEEENKIHVTLSEQNVIKILSYNMLEGFRGSTELKKEFAEWVKTYNPDIIVWQEMMGFSDEEFARFAATYGHDYSVLTKTIQIPTGITSKMPIENIRKVVEPAKLHHGFVYGKTFGINVYAIHLCPYNVDHVNNKYHIDRYDEMSVILNDAGNIPDDYPVIIAGDFNSHNQFDVDSYGDGFAYANRDHRVTDLCKQSGYFDTYPLLNSEFKGTCPTSDIAVNGPNKGFRIDYIMVNKPLKNKCVYSDIIQTKFTDKASDHYPVYTEIQYGK